MSGHSRWSNIKHKKAKQDKKRAKIFSKLTRKITVAAREGGGDPDKNPDLRSAIEKARDADMPKDNIERAIKKGTGELEGGELEELLLGLYGPGGIAILIEAITDNKNRTLNEIKQILKENDAKLAETDSVRWQFEKKGVIVVQADEEDKEELELKIIDSGADDLKRNEKIEVYTKLKDLSEVKKNLEQQEIKIEDTSVDWVAKEESEVDEEKEKELEKLFEELDENDAVQDIYSNLKT